MNARDDSRQVLKYASGYHAPVLWHAVIQELVTDRDGLYVDGTLGGGGHSAALLDALSPAGRVVAIDRDDDALEEATVRLGVAIGDGRLQIVKGNFCDAPDLLAGLGLGKVSGLLLDLGVSSHQLDEGDRGFSHRFEGPLDMRMDQSGGEDASDLINRLEPNELARVLGRYGEEPKAGRVARALVAARPLHTTAQVADIVRSVAKWGQESKTLSRVFQGLRIAVNEELDALDRILEASTDLIAEGGRLAVISYHSLEDRRVKHFMRSGNLRDEIQKDFYGNKLSPWKETTRKPILADEQEIETNPRSRSARLRVAERLKDSDPSPNAHPDHGTF
ncbi:MAG: 16S rRNA (cytosine(1402)-N(4))-methyltransferase RsmH [Bacteroidetes bacterium]|nr:16S rRNA (cytosine(1402)-N(4))-methyltransferase RsmH [Bacteroidota bacterium]